MRVVVFLIMFLYALNGYACESSPNNMFDRLNDSKIIFIGYVKSVVGKSVVFDVEHQIKGVELKLFNVELLDSGCNNVFKIGQKWLYAGESVSSPSLLLEEVINGKKIIYKNGIRVGDLNLGLKKEWQECESSLSCETIVYACSSTSLNYKSFSLGLKHVREMWGSPSFYNCIQLPDKVFALPLCVKNKCGNWIFK